MKLQHHLIASVAVGSAVYLYFNSLPAAAIAFFSGVFVDLDHYLDYVIQYKALNIRHFFKAYRETPPLIDKYFIFLHSFELIFLYWFIINILNLGLLHIALAIGVTQHIVLDYSCNKRHTKPHFYFVIARYLAKFKRERLFR